MIKVNMDDIIKIMKKRLKRQILELIVMIAGMLMGIGGIIWLFFLDWRIGLAVLLMFWGQSLENAVIYKKKREQGEKSNY